MLVGFNLSAQEYKTHKVKEGETIESIAKMYLVTPFDIYALNPDAKTNFEENTVLIIPDSKVKNQPLQEEVKEVIGFKKHKVRRKETLYSISKKYGVSIADIKKYNTSLYAENLRKGDRIQIPRFKTVVSQQTLSNTLKKYIVQPKEGKWRVAYKFGITVPELEALNPNMKPVLQPGDELNVPNIANNEEKETATDYNYYEVQPKEGFYRLKVKLGLTKEVLETLNPELKDSGLKAGMVLKIPLDVEVYSESVDETNITDLKYNITNTETKKIALLLPFRLNRIDMDSVAEVKAIMKKDRLLAASLDFHSGVLMALDSAKQLGISTQLKVLDTENRVSQVARIAEDNDFSDYDAIIGPMMSKTFDRFSAEIKGDRVPVIAPLSKPTKVHDHVFQTIPNKELLSKAIVNYIKTDSTKAKVIVIADQSQRATSNMLKKEFPAAKQIFSRNNKKGKDAYFIYPLDLENVFVKGINVVFLETRNEAFASSVISMLNSQSVDDIQIVLTTTDKNKAFEGDEVDNYHLSNLQFHYPSVNKSFDVDSPNGFIKAYSEKYGVSPNKYAIRGFDLTLDVLLRLASKDNLYEASSNAIETEYIENKFRYAKKLFGGYTNEAVYIVKYDNLKIVNVD